MKTESKSWKPILLYLLSWFCRMQTKRRFESWNYKINMTNLLTELKKRIFTFPIGLLQN